MVDKRKKVLFILGVLDSGGVAKSLVNLLNVIDRSNYDVSLLLVSKKRGPYYDLLPKNLKIIHNEVMSAVGSVIGLKYLLIHGHLMLAFGTLIRLLVACFSKSWSAYLLSRLMLALPGEYDLIVDYNGQQQTYYMVDKLQAKKKVAFFHSDYSKWPYYYKIDKKYYPKLDAIFTISPTCVRSLKEYFPKQASKIKLMENISSVELINKMASEEIGDSCASQWNFLTIGHVCKQKGTDLAIKAGKILKDKGIDFTWSFIGNVSELDKFETLLDECNVRKNFLFLGVKTNPYPYIKNCNVFVHPSLFEGKSVTLDEAKILCKPIVVTDFSTVHDQFENGVNANIVSMTPRAIADGILDLILHPEKRLRYTEYLKANIHDNSSEINKLYNLLN